MEDTIAIVQLAGDKGMDQLYDRGSGDALADALKIPTLKEAYSTYSRDMLRESYLGIKNDSQIMDSGTYKKQAAINC